MRHTQSACSNNQTRVVGVKNHEQSCSAMLLLQLSGFMKYDAFICKDRKSKILTVLNTFCITGASGVVFLLFISGGVALLVERRVYNRTVADLMPLPAALNIRRCKST